MEFLIDRIVKIVVSRGASPRHDGEMHLLLHPFKWNGFCGFSLLSWNISNSIRIYLSPRPPRQKTAAVNIRLYYRFCLFVSDEL